MQIEHKKLSIFRTFNMQLAVRLIVFCGQTANCTDLL